MENLNPLKLTKFNESLIKEYNETNFSQKVAELIKVSKTNGKFIQIGVKQRYEKKFLEKDPKETSYSPELIGMGRIIAYGERDFFIQKILEVCKEINEIYLQKEEILSKLKKMDLTNEEVILISSELKWDLFYSKEGITTANFKDGNYLFLNKTEVIPIPSKSLPEDIIIIVNKKEIQWNKLIFKNLETKKDETIDITIEERNLKELTLTIRSVNEILIKPEKIKKIKISNNN